MFAFSHCSSGAVNQSIPVPISLLGSFGITEIDLSNPLPQTLEYSADAIANLNQSKTLRVISGEKDTMNDMVGWKLPEVGDGLFTFGNCFRKVDIWQSIP